MMRSIVWAAGFILAGLGCRSDALEPNAFDLVTDSEAALWNTTRPTESSDFKTRDLSNDNAAPSCSSTADNDADNPQIKILAPPLDRPLQAPIDIDVQFTPVGGTHIRPETLRVCYLGLITVDITERITSRITVTEHGLHVTGARLPHGQHRLLLLISDQHARLARREAVFDIQ